MNDWSLCLVRHTGVWWHEWWKKAENQRGSRVEQDKRSGMDSEWAGRMTSQRSFTLSGAQGRTSEASLTTGHTVGLGSCQAVKEEKLWRLPLVMQKMRNKPDGRPATEDFCNHNIASGPEHLGSEGKRQKKTLKSSRNQRHWMEKVLQMFTDSLVETF